MFTVNLTREQFEAKKRKLAVDGVRVNGDAGEIHLPQFGVKLKFSYIQTSLMVQVVDKPFLVPESMVESRAREWFEGA
jgi:hypothetical protein